MQPTQKEEFIPNSVSRIKKSESKDWVNLRTILWVFKCRDFYNNIQFHFFKTSMKIFKILKRLRCNKSHILIRITEYKKTQIFKKKLIIFLFTAS